MLGEFRMGFEMSTVAQPESWPGLGRNKGAERKRHAFSLPFLRGDKEGTASAVL
jgi:hypothetical protein